MRVRTRLTTYQGWITSVRAIVQVVSCRLFVLRYGFSPRAVQVGCEVDSASGRVILPAQLHHCSVPVATALNPACISHRNIICVHPVLNRSNSCRNLGHCYRYQEAIQCYRYQEAIHVPILQVTTQQPRNFISTAEIRQFRRSCCADHFIVFAPQSALICMQSGCGKKYKLAPKFQTF